MPLSSPAPASTPAQTGQVRLAAASLFCLLTGYYALRPVRDELGVQASAGDLPWLFSLTFILSLTLIGVTRLVGAGRAAGMCLAFAASLAGAAWLQSRGVAAGPVLFVWISAWSYLLTALFWSRIAETPAAGARGLALIAAGGSAGALAGPALAGAIVGRVGLDGLLLSGAGLVALGAFGLTGLGGAVLRSPAPASPAREVAPAAAYIFLLQVTATLFYFQQLRVVEALADDPIARTRLFAHIDLFANLLAVAVQLTLTRWLLRDLRLGLLLTPAVAAGAFVWLALAPSLLAAGAGAAVRRAMEYAVARPARELLFAARSPLARRRYKVGIDAGLTRAGDMAGAWGAAGLMLLGSGGLLAGQLLAAGAFAGAGLIAARSHAAAVRVSPLEEG